MRGDVVKISPDDVKVSKGRERGDGVADFKRRRQDFQSDGVPDLAMALGRSQLKVALEDSTWRWRHDYNTTSLGRFL
ncbi:hypothetical protein Tco_0382456 [Tanacetum coccineum]